MIRTEGEEVGEYGEPAAGPRRSYDEAMAQWTRISTFATDSSGKMASTYRYVRQQPNWVVQIALLVFLIVVGLPILLLVLLAFALAVIVFGSLAMVNAIIRRVRGVLPRDDGRRNVRIVARDQRP